MSEKDIKTKPTSTPKAVKNTPKIAVKGKETVTNTVKNAKAVTKDTLVKQTIEKQLSSASEQQQSNRPENYAIDNVENTAYTTTDTAYHKSKTFVHNRIKEHHQKVKTRDSKAPEALTDEQLSNNEANAPKTSENEPKTAENYKVKETAPKNEKVAEHAKTNAQQKSAVKTKKEYLKSQNGSMDNASVHGVKTKENYIREHIPENAVKGVKSRSATDKTLTADGAVTPKDARREYVSQKLKTKAEYRKKQAEELQTENVKTQQGNAPKDNAHLDRKELVKADKQPSKSSVKTKENYMQSLRDSKADIGKTPYNNSPKSRVTARNVKRGTANFKKALKTRDNVVGKSKSIVKSGNAYTGKKAKNKTAKTTKRAVKTQKELAKKTAKAAAKQARQAAIKAARAAKIVAIKTAKAVVAITKAIVAAVTKAAAAFFAAFGWIGVAIVLVILIVIIIVAAIAGSPFGIFISDEAADQNSIPLSSIVAECNVELSNKLTEIEDGTTHDRVVMEGEQASWDEVIAIFAVKVAGTGDETAQDVVVIDTAKKGKLKEVFWDMNSISSRTETVTSGETTETVLYITINSKTKDAMISQYGFNEKQKEALETLLDNNDVLLSATQSLAISDATAKDVLASLPDNLSAERKAVIKAACSLVGKVNYFWGGKSAVIGWDSEWGKMKLVTAEGSRSTGSMRPFGLDCSGFVTWSFINAGFSASDIGHGTKSQVAKGTRISLSSAQAGDLAFYNDISHVGIVAGKDASGNVLVIHCSSGANNVVITTGGFSFAIRPSCY